jgi:hypothetical protein
MQERGKLIYEEQFKEERIQGELSSNHIGIFGSFLVIILTWTLMGYGIGQGTETLYLVVGLVISLILTFISLYLVDKFIGLEFTQNLPIKIYEKGILMPTTPFERMIRGMQPFIYNDNLESVRRIRTHNPNQKDLLIVRTKRKKEYVKRYDGSSDVPNDILENMKKSAPSVTISVSE